MSHHQPSQDMKAQLRVLANDFEECYSSCVWGLQNTRDTQSDESSRSSDSSASWDEQQRAPENLELFEIRISAKGGLGIFATRDIEENTMILSELPLLRANLMEVYGRYEELPEDQKREYLMLHPFYGTSCDKVLAIYNTNRFYTAGRPAVFTKAARFNHACVPFCNSNYRFSIEEERLIITAARKICNGEEITISYTNEPEELPLLYGFHCDCPDCVPLLKQTNAIESTVYDEIQELEAMSTSEWGRYIW